MKEATATLNADDIEKSTFSNESEALAVLDSPSHLIPSVNILFSTFMDSLLSKPESTDKTVPMDIDTEMDSNDMEQEIITNDNLITEQSINTETFDSFDIFSNAEYTSLAKQISAFALS